MRAQGSVEQKQGRGVMTETRERKKRGERELQRCGDKGYDDVLQRWPGVLCHHSQTQTGFDVSVNNIVFKILHLQHILKAVRVVTPCDVQPVCDLGNVM